MRKITIRILVGMLLASFAAMPVFADRNAATTTTYNSSTLVKTGNAILYRVTFVASSANGKFEIYDALTSTSGNTDVKAEGAEATSGNSQFQDFSDKPLELDTGLYLKITNGFAIVSYE